MNAFEEQFQTLQQAWLNSLNRAVDPEATAWPLTVTSAHKFNSSEKKATIGEPLPFRGFIVSGGLCATAAAFSVTGPVMVCLGAWVIFNGMKLLDYHLTKTRDKYLENKFQDGLLRKIVIDGVSFRGEEAQKAMKKWVQQQFKDIQQELQQAREQGLKTMGALTDGSDASGSDDPNIQSARALLERTNHVQDTTDRFYAASQAWMEQGLHGKIQWKAWLDVLNALQEEAGAVLSLTTKHWMDTALNSLGFNVQEEDSALLTEESVAKIPVRLHRPRS